MVICYLMTGGFGGFGTPLLRRVTQPPMALQGRSLSVPTLVGTYRSDRC